MRAKKASTASPPRKSSACNLAEYETKRHLDETCEPQAIVPARPRQGDRTFVVHQHDSRNPHFDFRLEMNGVLKSWAVPKGLPIRSGEKRLAIQVEDHPLRYAQFQGVIPPGNYGAGTVSIWDTGHYETDTGDPLSAWTHGKIHVQLHGERLQGTWTLVRMESSPEAQVTWLILKSQTPFKAAGGKVEPRPQKRSPGDTPGTISQPRPGTHIALRSGQPWKDEK